MKIIRTSTVPISLNILLRGQLAFLNKNFEVVGISSKGAMLNEVHDREGINTVAINIERGISPVKDIISLTKLYIQFKKEKPAIVHSITPKAGLLTMLAGKMAKVPIRMHTFTGLIFPTRTGFIQKVLIKMDQLLCWAATNIYPEGNGVKNDLINYKITSKPLKVLANGNVNGIDLEYFSKNSVSEQLQTQLKIELNISDNDFVFVFVGRLVGDKGINELVQAFKQISVSSSLSRTANQKQIKLLLVGSFETELDPLRTETLKEIKTNPNIISVGFQKEVHPYFAISDALVFPSYREGFPNVVMQAGAMGLPSIVSNINGCNEIIVEGENGTIIPVKNADAILGAMQKLIEDKAYYNQLQEKARPMIQARYEQQVVWNALLQEYQRLLGEVKSKKEEVKRRK
ncbi:glycosyltransferase family 4 protein [Flavobacterium sp. xlx-214]|uniref:glycosyltransferase family 4 protein n=1 Tax=unclassified Flavobacterium TaxID=196869 RepID=UPI0013D770F8|nr:MULTISPECIES: glycosyltransferase family 4 protein [unclassified Flavobacterium]MBA5794037.1 glycosyltransferase family 4 protein [Flavobacterium sp. xlx-221]QMI83148.1 glycosyltransferase family 4 protein [Flavobacterium sp. xlx-214]